MKIINFILGCLLINNTFASDIIVTVRNQECTASVAGQEYRCSIGKNGITTDKVEGDGKTPIGKFPLRQIFALSDKIVKNNLKYVSQPVQILKPEDGWCDDPKNKSYNKQVDLNNFDLAINHEKLWRDDDLYNIIIVVGYNDAPIVAGKGSALFIRVAHQDYAGTAGGVGFAESDLLKILAKLDDKSKLIVKNSFSN